MKFLFLLIPVALRADDVASMVRPFVSTYCVSCHSGANAAAQFDLTPYDSLASVVKDHGRWHLVAEKLKSGEMPPKGMKQPPASERQKMTAWVDGVLQAEARRNAGDPGPVLARRLNNAEYNYTIRDLTGVDIRPAREFPVDPANPEGFDNSGESLSMSPALLNKYLQAAREVANHMVLTPDGFDFAPHPTLVETDREKYTIQRIVNFYAAQPTDYADYFEAAWHFKRSPGKTLAQVARERNVSPKYLPLVWNYLEGPKEPVGPGAKLQALWRALPAKPERAHFLQMREWVVRVRRLTAKHYQSPMVRGLSATSQPLMNYKLRQFANNRREFDENALMEEGQPLPVIPEAPKQGTFFAPGNYDIVARQALAKLIKERLADPEPLKVPAGKKPEYSAAFGRFGKVFPDAFYIRERGRFFPDLTQDTGRLLSAGYHNVMGYFRDDLPLRELILDAKQIAELERLWLEFDMIADYTIRTYVQYFFNQSGEIMGNGRESGSFRPSDNEITAEGIIMGLQADYLKKAESDPVNSPLAIEAIRQHFPMVNAAIRAVEKARADSEPLHLRALAAFAEKAYRRPLSGAEAADLTAYYKDLREKSLMSHEDAMRDSITGILMSPEFCYRVDTTKTSSGKHLPLTDYALANRLSYFLWASKPDEELLRVASAGQLSQPQVLRAQARRMLKDERTRRFATEFAGHWLDFRRFEEHNAVDRGRFPQFTDELRQAMFEEPVRFLEDVVRNDRSVLELLYGKHTFVNGPLAKHYGMPEVKDWTRVNDAAIFGRGGILAMSVFLTNNSPGLRTSPVKRGYWVARRVLGEAIPPPPPSVPELPADEAKLDLPLRDKLAQHRANPACAGCHARFDGFGLAFEGYGPAGEKRDVDLGGRPVDPKAEFPGGKQGAGPAGVQAYIRANREKDFVENLCRKLLAYSLGRSLMLSDEITIERMRTRLAASGYRFGPLIETIVTSPQFSNRRRGD
ncbi:MAG: DUF1592 domain-containing protein [Acidobacteria bacterium]|nr:DUF1592 domain-containing protein [Acidobacteriota bacterium]